MEQKEHGPDKEEGEEDERQAMAEDGGPNHKDCEEKEESEQEETGKEVDREEEDEEAGAEPKEEREEECRVPDTDLKGKRRTNLV